MRGAVNAFHKHLPLEAMMAKSDCDALVAGTMPANCRPRLAKYMHPDGTYLAAQEAAALVHSGQLQWKEFDIVKYVDWTARQRPQGLRSGMLRAAGAFVHKMVTGVTGVVTKPLQGAQQGGAKGAMQGLGEGLLGIVVQPGKGFKRAYQNIVAGMDEKTQVNANFLEHAVQIDPTRRANVRRHSWASPADTDQLMGAQMRYREAQQAVSTNPQASKEAEDTAASARPPITMPASALARADNAMFAARTQSRNISKADQFDHFDIPQLNVLIMIVGSRGDIQPFCALAQALKENFGHRVRIATHKEHESFVMDQGVEFHPIGGEPRKLMAFMVKHGHHCFGGVPLDIGGLLETPEQTEQIKEIVYSTWAPANKLQICFGRKWEWESTTNAVVTVKAGSRSFCEDAEPGTKVVFHGEVEESSDLLSEGEYFASPVPEQGSNSFELYCDRAMTQRVQRVSIVTGYFQQIYAPFQPDAIIANPPSWTYFHLGEKLGIPVHIMFPQPWLPTKYFPHPFANMRFTDVPQAKYFQSYDWVDNVMWRGSAPIQNAFRRRYLGLPTIHLGEGGHTYLTRGIPFAFMWSPALVPKPPDWPDEADVVGNLILPGSGMSDYKAPQDLLDFLDAAKAATGGLGAVFVGFGSCVLPDPEGFTNMLVEAVKLTKEHIILQSSWSKLEVTDPAIRDRVFMLGPCPHDWLFQHVGAVVHHGGAGTTTAGLMAGKPTLIVPFFGDQPFWGWAVKNARVGPAPIPSKELDVKKLVAAFRQLRDEDVIEEAKTMAKRFKAEDGVMNTVRCFHKHLPLHSMLCDSDWNKTRDEVQGVWRKATWWFTEGRVINTREQHGFCKGAVVRFEGSTRPMSGVKHGGSYYVQPSGPTAFQLFADSKLTTLVAPAIRWGVFSLQATIASVDAGVLMFAEPGHGFLDGTRVRFDGRALPGSAVRSLSQWFVKTVGPTAVELHPTDALDSKVLDVHIAAGTLTACWRPRLAAFNDRRDGTLLSAEEGERLLAAGRRRDELDPVQFVDWKAKLAPQGWQQGLAAGVGTITHTLASGLAGLVMRPLEGARDGAAEGGFIGGVSGAAVGIGRGVAGVVTKPARGVVSATNALHGAVKKKGQPEEVSFRSRRTFDPPGRGASGVEERVSTATAVAECPKCKATGKRGILGKRGLGIMSRTCRHCGGEGQLVDSCSTNL